MLCGDKNLNQVNVDLLKKSVYNLLPSKNNSMYDSHMYWSQRAFNICDILIVFSFIGASFSCVFF